jgi:hypothetical protein
MSKKNAFGTTKFAGGHFTSVADMTATDDIDGVDEEGNKKVNRLWVKTF